MGWLEWVAVVVVGATVSGVLAILLRPPRKNLTTWKAEFYPVAADVAMSEMAAVEHAIRKWTGLREENLRAHNVSTNRPYLRNFRQIGSPDVGDKPLTIAAGICALCLQYSCNGTLEVCPLEHCRDAMCDIRGADENDSPFEAWQLHADPEPMLLWLHKTKIMLEQEGSKCKSASSD